MRMAGDRLSEMAAPHMAAIASPASTSDEVVANMIALSELMGRDPAPDAPVHPIQTIRKALASPTVPSFEKVVLRGLLQQLEAEPVPGLSLPAR